MGKVKRYRVRWRSLNGCVEGFLERRWRGEKDTEWLVETEDGRRVIASQSSMRIIQVIDETYTE